MVVRNSFPNDLSTGQTVLDTRMTNAGLVARAADGTPRTGVIFDSDARIVSPTASMAYLVRDIRAVTSRSGTGVEFVANDGALTVPTSAAPTSNSRIDIIYIRARFIANADGSAVPQIAVASGAAAVFPQPPALPAGALELARFTIPSGVTATNQTASGVVGQDTCRFTAAAGGVVVVRDLADLAGWQPGDGARAYCLSDNGEYVRRAGVWMALDLRGTITPSTGTTITAQRLVRSSDVVELAARFERSAAIGHAQVLGQIGSDFWPSVVWSLAGSHSLAGASAPSLRVGIDGQLSYLGPSAGNVFWVSVRWPR